MVKVENSKGLQICWSSANHDLKPLSVTTTAITPAAAARAITAYLCWLNQNVMVKVKDNKGLQICWSSANYCPKPLPVTKTTTTKTATTITTTTNNNYNKNQKIKQQLQKQQQLQTKTATTSNKICVIQQQNF